MNKTTNISVIMLILFLSAYNLFSQWLPSRVTSSVSNIKYLFTATDRIIAVTDNYDYYYSDDNAEHWNKMNFSATCYSIDARDSLVVIADYNSIYISTDYGDNFVKHNFIQNSSCKIRIIKNKIYVAVNSKLLVSEDLANTWNNIIPNSYSFNIYDFTVHNDSTFIRIYENDSYKLKILTNDTIFNTSLQNITSVAIRYPFIFVGSDNGFYISKDFGKSWLYDTLKNGITNLYTYKNNIYGKNYKSNSLNKSILYYYSDDQQRFNPLPVPNSNLLINTITAKKNYLFLGTSDKGVILSPNTGKTWNFANLNFNTLDFSIISSNKKFLFSLTKYNSYVYLSDDNGKTWTPAANGLGVDSLKVKMFAADDTIIYALANNNSIYKFNNSIKKWNLYANFYPNPDESFNSIAVKGELILAITDYCLYKLSKNLKWEIIKSPLTGTNINLAICSPYIILSSFNYENDSTHRYYYNFSFSPDTGKTWILTGKANGLDVYSVNCFSFKDGIFYAGTNSGLYWSEDFGKSWKNNGNFFKIVKFVFYNNYIFSLSSFDNYGYNYFISCSNDKFKTAYKLENIDNNLNLISNLTSAFIISFDTIIASFPSKGVWFRKLSFPDSKPLSFSIAASGRFCSGDSAMIKLNNPYFKSYTLFNLSTNTNKNIVLNPDSLFYIKVTGKYRILACNNPEFSYISESFNISFHSPAKLHLATENYSFLCKDNPVSLVADSLSPDLSLQWQFNDSNIVGATYPSYKASIPGRYNLIIYDTCNIIKSNPVIITNDSIPEIKAMTYGSNLLCNNDSVLIYTSMQNKINTFFLEDFETADLSKFYWHNNSRPAWTINSTKKFQGNYSLCTGGFDFDNLSNLSLNLNYNKDDSISFYLFNETNYGKIFEFYINSVKLVKVVFDYRGLWHKYSFPVKAGNNTFLWKYFTTSDPTGNVGYLDNIRFKKFSEYNYQWYKNGLPVQGATSYFYYAKSPAEYYVIVSNNCFSISSSSASIYKTQLLDTSVTVSLDSTNSCRKGASLLKAPYLDNVKYTWQRDNKNIINPNPLKSEYYADTSGSYRVIFDYNNCQLTSAYKTININKKINPKISYIGAYSACQDSFKTLHANLDNNYKYLWKLDGKPISDATLSSYNATTSGFYSVNLIDNNCNETSPPVFIKILPLNNLFVNSYYNAIRCNPSENNYFYLSNYICINSDTVKNDTEWFTDSDFGGVWNITNIDSWNGFYSIKSGSNFYDYSSLQFFAKNIPKYDSLSFYCKTILSDGCKLNFSLSNNNRLIDFKPANDWTKFKIPLDEGSNNIEFYVEGTGTPVNEYDGLYLDNISNDLFAGASFQWQKDSIDIPGANSLGFSTYDEGNYRLKISNNCGTVFSKSFNVTNSKLYNINISYIKDSSDICISGAKYLVAPLIDSTSYYWYYNNTNTYNKTNIIQANNSGIYEVSMRDKSCYNSASDTISIKPAFSAKILPSDSVYLCDSSSVLAHTDIHNAKSYQWFKNNSIISDATNDSLIIFDQGYYTLKSTLLNNCLANSPVLSVFIQPKPLKPIILADKSAMCLSDSITLEKYDLFNINKLKFQWKKNNIEIPDANLPVFTAKESGNYSLLSFNDCGQTISDSFLLTAIPSPNISPLGFHKACDNDTITLDAGPGFTSYLWSNAATTQIIKIDSSGIGIGSKTISVEVSNQYACKAKAFATVEFDDCTSINENPYEFNISFTPNPVSSLLNIYLNSSNKNITTINLEIFNNLAQSVYNSILNIPSLIEPQTIDLSKLPNGIYLLRLSNNKTNFTAKIIKQ